MKTSRRNSLSMFVAPRTLRGQSSIRPCVERISCAHVLELLPQDISCCSDNLRFRQYNITCSEGCGHTCTAPGPSEALPEDQCRGHKEEKLDRQGRGDHDRDQHGEERGLAEDSQSCWFERENFGPQEDEQRTEQELPCPPLCPLLRGKEEGRRCFVERVRDPAGEQGCSNNKSAQKSCREG